MSVDQRCLVFDSAVLRNLNSDSAKISYWFFFFKVLLSLPLASSVKNKTEKAKQKGP